MLRTLLIGPLRFMPVRDGRRVGCAFQGALAVDRMLGGVVELPTVVASPTGFAKLQNAPLDGIIRRRAA